MFDNVWKRLDALQAGSGSGSTTASVSSDDIDTLREELNQVRKLAQRNMAPVWLNNDSRKRRDPSSPAPPSSGSPIGSPIGTSDSTNDIGNPRQAHVRRFPYKTTKPELVAAIRDILASRYASTTMDRWEWNTSG
eukprot:5974791-Lingulodinium_polyedra.AAC.1